MAVNIDFSAVFTTIRPDSHNKAAVFPVNTDSKAVSFRDTLREAVLVRDRDGKKPDNNILRKDMIKRPDMKQKKAQGLADEKERKALPENDGEEKKADRKTAAIEELMAMLEELTALQQSGALDQKGQELLDGIKEALKELAAAGTSTDTGVPVILEKTMELVKVLEGMMKELVAGGNQDKAYISELAEQLGILLKEAEPKAADVPSGKTSADGEAAVSSKENGWDTESVKAAAGSKVQDSEAVAGKKEEVMAAELPEDRSQGKDTEVKAKGAVQTKTEAQPAEEESGEAVKTALDGKVDKVAVEEGRSKESKGRDAGKENDGESAGAIRKTAPEVHNSTAFTEETGALGQNQTVPEIITESVQNQAPVQKTQIVSKAEVINQIVKKAELIITDAQPEMRMQLEPENLGRLSLKIAVEKGLITAKFVAESQEVKQILESGFNELRDILQEKGLEVQNISVSVGHDREGHTGESTFQQWKESVRLNGRSVSRTTGINGYLEEEGTAARVINPYNIHFGSFDQKA